MEYAEHLYTDPTLWRVTLEYLGACGKEGRAMVAEVVMRVPVDISIPSPSSDDKIPNGTKGKGKDVNGGQSDLDMIFTDADVSGDMEELEKKAWSEWEDKVLKIIDVCKDYGLEDVLYSVCRVSFIPVLRSPHCCVETLIHSLVCSPFRRPLYGGVSMGVLCSILLWLEMGVA